MQRFVAVEELLGPELVRLDLEVLSGQGHLDRKIQNPRVQKPGLAFAGHYAYIKPARVQIIGESETDYLLSMSPSEREERCRRILELPVPVFVVTKGLDPVEPLLALCREAGVPLLQSQALSSTVIKAISLFLEERLVPSTHLHGVLLEIYGLGVLLVGDSGVGKSECALDLIAKGHSLVADDRVSVKRFPTGELIGFSTPDLRHHMEVRGLGIINIQDLFGLAAVRERKQVDLVVHLESWDEAKAYDRLGLDESSFDILDTAVAYIEMPVALGRNLSILVEIAARNHVLKLQGYHSGRELIERLRQRSSRTVGSRTVDSTAGDGI